MRIAVRVSRLSKWARRLALVAVPLLLLAILFHRAGSLPSESFRVLLALGLAAALVATLFGVLALVRLWYSGDAGWGRALVGVLVGGACLVPVAYGAYLASAHPRVDDVATTPGLVPPEGFGVEGEAATFLDPAVAIAFPDLRTRLYPLDGTEVFAAIVGLAETSGWETVETRAPAGQGAGRFVALAMTLLGWRDLVVLDIVPAANGTNVDMRSSALVHRLHDLGANGQRIEDFLAALDAAMAARLPASVPIEDELTPPPVEEGLDLAPPDAIAPP